MYLKYVNFIVSKLFLSKAVKRVQGKKRLFLVEELGEYFLPQIQFKLYLKGQVVFGSENKQQSILERGDSLSKV